MRVRSEDALLATHSHLDFLGACAEHWLVVTRARVLSFALDLDGYLFSGPEST